jgi:hypothetical protein
MEEDDLYKENLRIKRILYIVIGTAVILCYAILVYAFVQKSRAKEAMELVYENRQAVLEQERQAMLNAQQCEATTRKKDSIIAVLNRRLKN